MGKGEQASEGPLAQRSATPVPLWRDPLWLFMALGALVYGGETLWRASLGAQRGLAGHVASGAPSEDGAILISAPLLERWASEHETAGRPFDGVARQARIDQHVEQEALLREARLMGLDREDLIVRRRLLQKMRFLLEDLAEIPEPSEADLQSWLESRRDQYRRRARLSLEHRFFSADRRPGDQARRDALRALEVLQREEGEGALSRDGGPRGDPFVLGVHFKRRTQAQLARSFGAPFAEAVMSLSAGQWRGPIKSSYGQHLVMISERAEARDATLEEVRPQVLADWLAAARRRAAQAAIAEMVQRHSVVIEDDVHQGTSPSSK